MAAKTRQSRVSTLILTIVTILISIPARAEDPSPWISPQTVDIGKGQAEAQAISVGYDDLEHNKELQLKIQMSPAYGSIQTSNVVLNPGSIWSKVSGEAQEHVFATQGLDSDTTFYAHFEGTLSLKGSGTGTGTGAAGPKPFHVKVADVDLDCDSDNDGVLADDRAPERDDNEDEREAAAGGASSNGGGMMLPADISKWAILKLTLHTRVPGTLDLFNHITPSQPLILAKNKQGEAIADETFTTPGTYERTYYVRAKVAQTYPPSPIIATFTPSGPKGGSKSGRAQDVLLIAVGNSLVLDINNTAKLTDDFVPVLQEAPPAGTRRVRMKVRLAPPGVDWSGDYAVTLDVPSGLGIYAANADGDPITGVTLDDGNSYQEEVWLEAGTPGEKTITASAEGLATTEVKAKCVTCSLGFLPALLKDTKTPVILNIEPADLKIGVPVHLAITRTSGSTGAAVFESNGENATTIITDYIDLARGTEKSSSANNLRLRTSINGVIVADNNFTVFEAALVQSGAAPLGKAKRSDPSIIQWYKSTAGTVVTVTATLTPTLDPVPDYVQMTGGSGAAGTGLSWKVPRDVLGSTTVRLSVAGAAKTTGVEIVTQYLADTLPTVEYFDMKGGNVYVKDNGYWCPRGGKGIFKVSPGSPSDRDEDAAHNKYWDTFNKSGAVRWRGINADWNPTFGLQTTWTPQDVTPRPDPDDRNVMLDIRDDGTYFQDIKPGVVYNNPNAPGYLMAQSIVVHLEDSAQITSIEIKDKNNPGRFSPTELEVSGGQTISLKANKTQGDWVGDYPEWTIKPPGAAAFTLVGETKEFDVTQAGVPKSVLWIVNAEVRKYTISVIDEANGTPRTGSVVVYPNSEVTFSWDLGKPACVFKEFVDVLPVFRNKIRILAPDPKNTKIFLETSWKERENKPLVGLKLNSGGKLEPLLGINCKVQLFGPPAFITKYLGAEAGVFAEFGGLLYAELTVNRTPEAAWGGELKAGGKITGKLSAEFNIGKYVQCSAYGCTAIGVEGSLTGDAVGLKLSGGIVWDGFNVGFSVLVKVGWRWEYSKEWPLIEAKTWPFGDGTGVYLMEWGKRI